MRVKLDENIPAGGSVVAAELGHDADTVITERMTGASDVDVLAAATREGRLLVTLDRGFGDVRAHPPGTHTGIVVLRVASQDPAAVNEALQAFLSSDELGDLAGCVVVMRGHLVRVRRPQ